MRGPYDEVPDRLLAIEDQTEDMEIPNADASNSSSAKIIRRPDFSMQGPYDDIPERLLAIFDDASDLDCDVDDTTIAKNLTMKSKIRKADADLALTAVSRARQQYQSHDIRVYNPKADTISAAAASAKSSVLPGVSLVVLQALQVCTSRMWN